MIWKPADTLQKNESSFIISEENFLLRHEQVRVQGDKRPTVGWTVCLSTIFQSLGELIKSKRHCLKTWMAGSDCLTIILSFGFSNPGVPDQNESVLWSRDRNHTINLTSRHFPVIVWGWWSEASRKSHLSQTYKKITLRTALAVLAKIYWCSTYSYLAPPFLVTKCPWVCWNLNSHRQPLLQSAGLNTVRLQAW